MAPIGLKLGQNAFQTIPDISIFDSGNFFSGEHFCPKMRFFGRKKNPPLFGEFKQTSQDIRDSDSDSKESWDVHLNAIKNGFLIFGLLWAWSEGLRV